MEMIANLMENDDLHFDASSGRIEFYDILPEYVAELNSLTFNLEGLKIVVDCSNGMASLVARSIWLETGAKITLIFDHIDGHFPFHAPNPANSDNLRQLGDIVLNTGADLGICFDGGW